MIFFPELYTARLKLRRLQVEDIPSLVKYANNKKISGYVLNIPYPYQEPDAVFRISYVVQGFKNKSRYVFAIILKKSDEFIGEISLHLDSNNNIAELGYWIGEPFWNKGIATEAVAAVLTFGFDKLGLAVIFATCSEDNPASQKLLINNGMLKGKVTGNIVQYLLKKEAFVSAKANSESI